MIINKEVLKEYGLDELITNDDVIYTPFELSELRNETNKWQIICLLSNEDIIHFENTKLFALWCINESLKLIENVDSLFKNAYKSLDSYLNKKSKKEELETKLDNFKDAFFKSKFLFDKRYCILYQALYNFPTKTLIDGYKDIKLRDISIHVSLLTYANYLRQLTGNQYSCMNAILDKLLSYSNVPKIIPLGIDVDVKGYKSTWSDDTKTSIRSEREDFPYIIIKSTNKEILHNVELLNAYQTQFNPPKCFEMYESNESYQIFLCRLASGWGHHIENILLIDKNQRNISNNIAISYYEIDGTQIIDPLKLRHTVKIYNGITYNNYFTECKFALTRLVSIIIENLMPETMIYLLPSDNKGDIVKL